MAPFCRFAADEDDASSPRFPRRLIEPEGKSAGENIAGGGSLKILLATVGRCRERWRKGVLGIVGFMDAFVVGIVGLVRAGLGTLPYEATSFCTAETSGGGA